MSVHVITLQAGTDQFCCVGYKPDVKQPLENLYARAFVRMQLPEAVRGRTPSAAVLSLYAEEGVNALTLDMKSSVAAWDGSSTHTYLNEMALSSTLESKSVEVSGNWTHFNVLGDVVKGVMEACQSSRTSLTFVPDYGGVSGYRQEFIAIGSQHIPPHDLRFFTQSGANVPYLTITFNDDRLPVNSGSGGGGPMF